MHVHRSLKTVGQLHKVVQKAHGILAFINRGIEYKGREVMMELYKTLVRPQLEYCVQFWMPHYRKDVIALEKVQRKFPRVLAGLECFSYQEKLDRLALFFFWEQGRVRGT